MALPEWVKTKEDYEKYNTELSKEIKKCPYCFSEMDYRASLCPSCKKKVGKTDKHGVGKKQMSALGSLGIVLFVFIMIGIIGSIIGGSKTVKPTYTEEQKKAGAKIQELFMQSGLVKEYTGGSGGLQVVYVDRMVWNFNSYEKKKELLKQFSQTNEIQGYTPWVEIRDYITGEVFAALKPGTVEVFK